MCALSFDLRKPIARVLSSTLLIVGGLVVALVAANIEASNTVKVFIGAAAIVVITVGYFVWTGKVKLGPHGG
jgi:hypothetical protein